MDKRVNVLVVGTTGMLGGKIAAALLDRGATPRLLIRPGGYAGDKAARIAALTARGATVVEADLAAGTGLEAAVADIDVIVSAVQGQKDIIIGGQSALLEAAERAGVGRFIPSDFSVDFFSLEDGSNRNLDLRRHFNRRLDSSPVAGTSVLNGAFMEMLVFGFPLLDRQTGQYVVWGDPEQTLQFTSTDDTAEFTAEVALDQNAPRKVCVAGAQVSQIALQSILERWLGVRLERHTAGDASALTAEIEREKREAPGGEGDLFPRWQALQYLHNMVSGAGFMPQLDNGRYPAVRPVSLPDFLQRIPPP